MSQRGILLNERTRFSEAMDLEGDRDTLWWRYDQAYEVTPATTQELSAEAHALRYQVYCLEKRFEDPALNPFGLESDAFDMRSLHCLLRHRETRIPVGTARLIMGDPVRPASSWPVQQVCRDPRLFDDRILPVASTAEVSRFCLSSEARARVEMARSPGAAGPAAGLADGLAGKDEAQLAPYTILGIIRGMLMISLRRGITHWTLVVEPALLRLLGRLGLHFTKLGPLVEFHGRRQPCYSDIAGLFERMHAEKPELWRIVTGCGRFAPEAAPDGLADGLVGGVPGLVAGGVAGGAGPNPGWA